jgi:hypothetical protein
METQGKDKLMNLFLDGSDKERLTRLITDPEGLLKELGIEVEDQFKEVVIAGLKEAVHTALKANVAMKKRGALRSASNNQDGITFSSQPWGLVLELDAEATTKVVDGVNLSGSVLAAAAAFSDVLPHSVSTVANIYSSYMAAYSAVIGLVNTGNGVSLTLTWPQITLIPIAAPVPVPMAIRY